MKFTLLLSGALFITGLCNAQLIITPQSNGQALAQRLVGDGITISNVTLSANAVSTGFFRDVSLTNVGLDSGIVLTNGRAKTATPDIGLDGDGVLPAYDPTFTTPDAFATNEVNYNLHDTDIAQLINVPLAETHDATVLEFDFIPTGDTIKFRYVFSSEEYPEFACPGFSNYNDAFAFFIQGPGFPAKTNIALIPGSTAAVTINNINDQACGVYPQFYVNNYANTQFTHNGHTTVFTAMAHVTPCQTYHLKLVIADVVDGIYDSGVFLEAKSLTSNIVTLTNNTQIDTSQNSYIVEGCVTGSFTIKRPHVDSNPLPVQLTYGGTVVNGVDIQLLPTTVIIPANDSMVIVNVIPLIDNTPEGIESLVVYAGAGCGSVAPVDSAFIQIRDYDTLTILPVNAFACKNGSLQLNTTAAFSATIQWDPVPGLSDYTIANPVATPAQSGVYYTCTATTGTCHQRDSVYVQWKELEFTSQQNVNCNNGTTGQVIVSGGPEWIDSPVEYSVNNQPSQPGGTFNNLAVGTYMVHITDASGCRDSLPVSITQLYPDLLITDTTLTPASCTAADGTITITGGGGLAPYQYSIDGVTFQASNVFNVAANTPYTITITDANNCITTMPNVLVDAINDLSLTAGPDTAICSGQSVTIFANSNAGSYSWSPTTGLSAPTSATTIASPTTSTFYTVTATLGACVQTATVTVSLDQSLSVDAGGPLYVDAGGSAQAQAVVTGANTDIAAVLWTPSEGLSATNILDPVVTPVNTSGSVSYNITVTNTSGCSASDVLLVNIVPNCIALKNAFTPNGDGINDLWTVYDDYSCLKNITVHVFNRYGSKVFESRDYRNKWDGSFKGKALPDGTYYAVVDFTMSSGVVRTVKTDLTILR